MPPASNLIILGLSAAASFLPGCSLSLAPRDALARLLSRRGDPDTVTVFRARPGPGERDLAELRRTASYWGGEGSGGRPRWEGVLVPSERNLYEKILERIDRGTGAITLRSYRFDAIWEDDLTLVDYLDEGGEAIGWDHASIPPELPEPRAAAGSIIHGYFAMEWWEYPQLFLDIPVYLAVGLKELAGEVIKSPLSFVSRLVLGAAVEGRSPVAPASLERAALDAAADWRNGFTALIWRFRVRAGHTPFDLLRELASAAPVIGPIFDWKGPPADSAPPPATTLIAVSPGVHGTDDGAGAAAAWARAVAEKRPEAPSAVLTYPHGGVLDPIWSILNISNGPGYDLASRIVFEEGVAPRDGVELHAFSGGAQRALAAARALRQGDVFVKKLVGVAGPLAGSSSARTTLLLLGQEGGDDLTNALARALTHLWLLPPNVARIDVRGAGAHHLPYFPNGATRAPELGYAAWIEEALSP